MTSGHVTTQALLEKHAKNKPNDIFVVFSGGAWTWQETLALARSVANGLRDVGIKPGDYVASWLPNGPEALLALFGSNLAGATQVPLNTAYRGRPLEHALRVSQARVLIVHYELIPHLASLELPALRCLIVVGGDDNDRDARFDRLSWSELERAPATDLPEECRRLSSDDMIVIFTSGTTGHSKGVRCSYRHHAAFTEWFSVGDLGPSDRALILLPLFHVGGTGWVFWALETGASIALLERFETRRFWNDVKSLGATTCTMVGAMANFLLQDPPQPSDADNPLRIALATPWIHAWPEFAKRFAVRLWAGFGMSEAPGPLRANIGEDITGLGKATTDEWELRVVDPLDDEVPAGTAGELLIRHRRPWVITHGYLGMPEATAEAWRNGWFHTGDIVLRHVDGTFSYVDRNKDYIRRRGENVSSLEVELEVIAHPKVRDAAVIAVPSDKSDDEVMVFVVLKASGDLQAEDLIQFLAPRMPHYMIPRFVEFVDDLPRTPTGKVRKVELRERGATVSTWDRERAGIRLRAQKLTQVSRDRPTAEGS